MHQLGRDICSGMYPPGRVLPPEGELCERFGFSRIVIREAVKSLVAKGMLAVRRSLGTLVLEPSEWNLFDPDVISWRAESIEVDPTMPRDLAELRRIVEPAAARLAAGRASPDERRALRAAYMAMERAVGGKGDYVQADVAFHVTIMAASGNQYIRQMQRAMSAMLRWNFRIVTRKPGGTALSLPLHEAVCIAIEQGDADAAERASLVLLSHSEDDLREQLAEGTPEPKVPRSTRARARGTALS